MIPESWADLPFFRRDWPALWARLQQELDWQPSADRIFHALHLTPRQRVRVVILGQDPYHTKGRATGLAFGFPVGEKPRYSLRNILHEAAQDTGRTPQDVTLETWAEQGVLLLNTALTVPVGRAKGHSAWGWNLLVQQILHAVAQDGPRAFILWGDEAQKLMPQLTIPGHLILRSAHPSPLSAHRGFIGSRPFSAVNRWLCAQDLPAIDWSGLENPAITD